MKNLFVFRGTWRCFDTDECCDINVGILIVLLVSGYKIYGFVSKIFTFERCVISMHLFVWTLYFGKKEKMTVPNRYNIGSRIDVSVPYEVSECQKNCLLIGIGNKTDDLGICRSAF